MSTEWFSHSSGKWPQQLTKYKSVYFILNCCLGIWQSQTLQLPSHYPLPLFRRIYFYNIYKEVETIKKKKKNTAHRISILSTVTLTFCSHYWMPHALASAALLKRTVSHLGVTYSPEFRRLSSPFISLWGNLCLVMGISHYSLGTVILSKKCLLNTPR